MSCSVSLLSSITEKNAGWFLIVVGDFGTIFLNKTSTLISMTISDDALQILTVLYNNKIKGVAKVKSDDQNILKLSLSEIELNNAIEFLVGKKLVSMRKEFNFKAHYDIVFETHEEDKNNKCEVDPLYLIIETKGIELIESDKKIHAIFGKQYAKIKKPDKTIQITNNNFTIENVSHHNAGHVNYGGVINEKIINDNAVTYKIGKVDMSQYEKYSKKIINTFGERTPFIFGIISTLSGLVTIFTGLNSFLLTLGQTGILPDWWYQVGQNFGVYFILLGFLFFFFGLYLTSLIKYKYESKCKKCKEFYALDPEDSHVREVETKEGTRKEITSLFKCKFCGYTETKTKNVLIKNE